jgi:hypothetical protein
MIKKTLPMIAFLGLIGLGNNLEALSNHCLCKHTEDGNTQTYCAGTVADEKACTQLCNTKYGSNLISSKIYRACTRYREMGCKGNCKD